MVIAYFSSVELRIVMVIICQDSEATFSLDVASGQAEMPALMRYLWLTARETYQGRLACVFGIADVCSTSVFPRTHSSAFHCLHPLASCNFVGGRVDPDESLLGICVASRG